MWLRKIIMMSKKLFLILFLSFPILINAQKLENFSKDRVKSVVDSTYVNNMILKQSFVVNVSLDSVWNAYTTKKGWESWAVAIAEIDFKINGTIKTNYNKNGKIGDESTITLNVINYLPKKMITLQAELTKNFPSFMKDDEKDLYNIILFEEVSATQTKIISYGIGYKPNKQYKLLLKFFIKGNEQSYLNLINYLETGKSTVNY